QRQRQRHTASGTRSAAVLPRAAVRVIEDLCHSRELLLQSRLVAAGCIAPGGLDLALALLPAFACGTVGDACAQVVLHLACLSTGMIGVAGEPRRLQADAAWLGFGVFAQVVVVVPGVALVQRRRREAFAVGDAGGRRRFRALGGRGLLFGLRLRDLGDDRWRRFEARDHHRRLDDLHFLLAALGAGHAVLDGQRAERVGAAV